ncbi:MAG TPA: AmmeMemoRadiSam system protein B [Thermotogota bacterium]|nr:AmmeMemoRadiSam system protein B [Thermotogota bacterium]
MLERKPIVAGIFYKGNMIALSEQIKNLFLDDEGPMAEPELNRHEIEKSFGLILPHAGYMASGTTAAAALYEAAKKGIPETIVIVGPNHTGLGAPVSVWDKGSWVTPFGTVSIDEELAARFLKAYDYAASDYDAHMGEHSIEIQLPLLQYVYGRDLKILPITLMDQRKKTAIEIGEVFSRLKDEKKCLFIASTDLNHYEPEEVTRKKDEEVITHILSSSVNRLYDSLTEYKITMCGFGPVTTLLTAGLGTPRYIKHSTSGSMNGDYSHVVGYFSGIIE